MGVVVMLTLAAFGAAYGTSGSLSGAGWTAAGVALATTVVTVLLAGRTRDRQ